VCVAAVQAVAGPPPTGVPVGVLGKLPVRWSPCEPGSAKPSLIDAPPPSSVVPAGQGAVACAGVLAVAGPGTWTCATNTGGAPAAQTAYACVALFWSPPPPLRPTAVHELGAGPSSTGAPLASLG
jgi:hypothetical protein